jgi:uncharacterized membrane protein YeiH
MTHEPFQIPIAIDLAATFAASLTGALAALRRGYDFVGLFALAFVTGVGGGLIRDGVFLQNGPPAVALDSRYLLVILAACAAGAVIGERVDRFGRLIAVLDAAGLGAYAVVGVEKSLDTGLAVPAAVLVGVINACGGGLLRDVLSREEPLLFKPGQFYTLAALAGAAVFALLVTQLDMRTTPAALVAIGGTFVLRLLAIRFNWTTLPLRGASPAEAGALTEKPRERGSGV